MNKTVLVTGTAGFIGSHTASLCRLAAMPLLGWTISMTTATQPVNALTWLKLNVKHCMLDVSTSSADISKARRLLGYDPKVSVEEGVRRFRQWYQQVVLE